ncbi:M14 family zinc carboxypeptidase [Lutibacter sp.]
MKIKLIVLVSVFNWCFLNAQTNDLANKYLKEKGEVFFSFKATSKSQIAALSRVVNFDDHKRPDTTTLKVYAYANKNQFKAFLEYGLPYEVKKEDNEISWTQNVTSRTNAWDTTWDAYPTYSEYVAKMNYYATTYPTLCSLQTIGTTVNGRELIVLKISDNVTINEAEPEFFYTSTMHGDELAGYPLMIRLIDYLLTNYGSNTEVTDLVNNTEIFINPLANPDGSYGASGNNTITAPTRANANGQDLNRNYPDNQQGIHYSSTGGVYEPETKAFMNFEASRHFVLSANFHGGVELVNYPYDNTLTPHADQPYYEYISVEYATNAQTDSDALGNTTYMTVDYDAATYPSPGVTNGAIWYVVYGGRQDYMNFYRHSKEVTIELSSVKWLNPSLLPNHWTYNKQAFLDYMKQANYGFQGIITDESGNPVVAKISISGHDSLNSWVTSSKELGDYYRLIKAGTYSVTYEAPGYITQTINVTVTDNAKTIQNVTMVAKTATPTANDVSICDSGSATLTASGTGTLNWYTTINGTTPISTGSTYNTPIINTTTTYYVEDVVTKPNVGDTRSNSGGGFLSGSKYLVFDCTESVLLKQVTINASQAGEMEVQLQDSSGNMLDSRIVLINNSGIQTINLDFMIPVGTNLRLTAKELSTGLTLYRNSTGTTYPYSNGSISITSSNAGTTYYYFFYDWVIEDYKSARKAVKAIVNPSPVANFTYVVNALNNGEVTFTNTSTNATTYTWDFGDALGTSTNISPIYTYNSSGTYNVQLTSTNANCGDDIITIPVSVNVTLGIEDEILSTFQMYPNPTTEDIYIKTPNTIDEFKISISTVLGQEVFNKKFKRSADNTYKIEVNDFISGIYFVTISTDLGKATKKIIIR